MQTKRSRWGKFDENDPRCTQCGRTFDEVGGHLGGTIDAGDGSPDRVLCIDCMTPEQRQEHAIVFEDEDDR